MGNLIDFFGEAIVGEVLLTILMLLTFLPFGIVDFAIVKKISRLKRNDDSQASKRFNRIKLISATTATIAVGVILGCIAQFVLKIDILEDDLSALVVIVVALGVLPLTMCIFDLVRYFKLKKGCHEENKKWEESEDADIWL